jgi:creatinine amidohydrolase
MKKILLTEMTWSEVKDALKKTDTVLIPVGSTEQHGPHLPLGTDTLIACKITEEVAKEVNAVVAPPIAIGFSTEHLDFPGTITMIPKTLMSLIRDTCRSLISHGFKKIIIVNGHGGNTGLIEAATRELKQETEATIVIVDFYKLIGEALDHKET